MVRTKKTGDDVAQHSHEAVDRRQEVPGAQQEEGETHDDKQTAQVHEGVLRNEPPERDSLHVHWNVLTLQEETRTTTGSQRT